MIGNDIIDLKYTRVQTDWTRMGFLTKVFSKQEQSIIHQSDNQFATVWRLWSMKESAYKVHMRSSQKRSFYPSKIYCAIEDEKYGRVEYENDTYIIKTEIQKEYIFSNTVHSELKQPMNHIYNIKASNINMHDYSDTILDQISLDLKCTRERLTLKRCQLGIPYLYNKEIKLDIDLSITHHGDFIGFSVQKKISR